MYYWGDQMKKNETGRRGPVGHRRGAYRVFVGKPEGQRQLEKRRHRWENNIKM
jgi:hypothetical protein